jgi:hypothetical protein
MSAVTSEHDLPSIFQLDLSSVYSFAYDVSVNQDESYKTQWVWICVCVCVGGGGGGLNVVMYYITLLNILKRLRNCNENN